jgi:hypothetical protein
MNSNWVVPGNFSSVDAEHAAGCEMTLDVEGVLEGGVNGQEALGLSGRFETLHLAITPSYRLAQILSPIVLAQQL